MEEQRREPGPASPPGGAWHRATTWAPLAGVALVMLVTIAFGRLIEFTGQSPAPDGPATPIEQASAPPTGLEREAGEYRARVGWALSGIALTLAMIVALIASVAVSSAVLRPFGARGRRWMAAAVLICLALGVFVWRNETAMLPSVLQERVDAIAQGVKQARELSKGAAVALILGLLLSMCATLAPCERTAAAVAARTRQLRVLLFVSAGLLVAGVVEISFLLRWPQTRLGPEEAKALGALADSITTAGGGVMAMLLIAGYGISSWTLMTRARSLAPLATEPARHEWLAANGLDSSLTQHLSRALVMISPWVASGPLSSLLDSLG